MIKKNFNNFISLCLAQSQHAQHIGEINERVKGDGVPYIPGI